MDAIEEFGPLELEQARKLFAGKCDFMLGVAALEQLPDTDLSEVAFAGRSNVGKSSLMNALTERTALARTSHTPGRTQQLNYFNLGDKIRLVDMPGYGYAKVSKTQREEWNQLIRNFLRGRPNLRCVFMLIDARHGLKDSDREIMKMLDDTAVSYRIIMTKADKVHESQHQALRDKTEKTLKEHSAAFPHIHLTSSVKGIGVPEFRAIIRSFAI